jgi:DNA excision repair protein ERCC-4
MDSNLTLQVDTREQWPHRYARFFPPGTNLVQATMETGDLALAGHDDVAVELKRCAEMASMFGTDRERFQRELARGRCLDAFCVVIEGSMTGVLTAATVQRGFSFASVMGTLASWTRRYRCHFVFCDTDQLAAQFAWRFLTGPIREAEARLAKARGAAARSARAVAQAQSEPEDDPEPIDTLF